MNGNISSGTFSGYSVIMPELSRIIDDPVSLDRDTSSAFSYGDKKGREILFGMRDMLDFVYPNGIRRCGSAEEYVETMERICSASFVWKSHSIVPVLPGLIAPPHDVPPCSFGDDHYRRLCRLGESMTVSPAHGSSWEFVSGIIDNAAETETHITVFTDRRIHRELMVKICNAWKSGADITMCSFANVMGHMGISGIKGSAVPAFYCGRYMLPGRTVMNSIQLDRLIDRGGDIYSDIKNALQDALENEVSCRYNISRHGRLYYKEELLADELHPWALLFPGCIGSADAPRVRSILDGGADHAVLSVSITDPGRICADTQYVIRCLAAACKRIDGYYPIKAVPCFHETKAVSGADQLREILRSHVKICGDAYGGALLELRYDDASRLPSPEWLASAIAGFYRFGGTALKIVFGGGYNE